MSNPLNGYHTKMQAVIARMDWGILAAFAAVYILWGSTYLAVAVALPKIPPFLLMGSRSLAGGLILLAYSWGGGEVPPLRLWPIAAACGLLFFVGCHGLLAFAQQHVASGVAALILATTPFWIVIIGFVLPANRPSRLRSVAFLVPGLAGVALIAGDQLAVGKDGPQLLGIVLLLVAAFAWALGSVLLERESSEQVSAIGMAGLALTAGGMALLGVSAGAGEFARFAFADLSLAAVLAWTYLVLAGTILAFVAYIWLLERVSPTVVSTYTFVNPVIAVLLGWAILGESFGALTLAGGGLVVISVSALLLVDAPAGERKQATADA
jgi:drug/metabolite transporter (DMT)-like permease